MQATRSPETRELSIIGSGCGRKVETERGSILLADSKRLPAWTPFTHMPSLPPCPLSLCQRSIVKFRDRIVLLSYLNHIARVESESVKLGLPFLVAIWPGTICSTINIMFAINSNPSLDALLRDVYMENVQLTDLSIIAGDAHCPRQNGVYPSEDPGKRLRQWKRGPVMFQRTFENLWSRRHLSCLN